VKPFGQPVIFVNTCEVSNISGMYEASKTPWYQVCFINPWGKQVELLQFTRLERGL
jgi:hypothetical protein